MSLPNYSPSGKILFGSVPWDNGYTNVRLYTSTSSQYTDIVSMMTLSSSNYTYIGRNRRIKVAIEADRLYHCNYCMYRNDSLTDGYIYCFITDVKYINDNTTEVTIETDVFNTYLYGTDWQIPACFIERETVPSEDSKYLFTDEPDFSLTYIADGTSREVFGLGGYIVMTTSTPATDATQIVPVTNPEGWYAKPHSMTFYKGIPCAHSMWFYPVSTTAGGSEAMEQMLFHLNYAGSASAVGAVFSIPSFASPGKQGYISGTTRDIELDSQLDISLPSNKNTLDGYTPRNSKLHYYPYSFCEFGDGQGQRVQLRYELMRETYLRCKYTISPVCKAFVFPYNYDGKALDYDNGIVVNAGALGSFQNSGFYNWMAQNSGTIALTMAGVALAGVSGGTSLAAASGELAGLTALEGAAHINEMDLAMKTGEAMTNMGTGAKTLKGAGATAAGGAAQMMNASHQPTTSRGQIEGNTLFSTSAQGVFAYRMVVKSQIAEQIDEFFDRWGYAVNSIEDVNITSRPSWNYVKTVGAAPKSLNGGAGSTAPFSRGRGTPAAALSVIRQAFDNGVTFWHTTSGFGNFKLTNSL